MTNPYDPITGKWLTPFAWAPIPVAPAINPADLIGATPEIPRDPGPNSGTAENKGVAGQDNGYNGKVDNWQDMAKIAAGGLTGNALKILYAALTAPPLAPGPTPIALPSGDRGPGLGSGQIEINPTNAGGFGLGALAGSTADPNILGSGFDITGGAGNSMSGGGNDMVGMNSETADRTSEARGFATGGYTGNIPRGAVAGPVHGQEFVFSAPATHAIGPDVLAALNAALSRHHVPFGWGTAR